MVDNEHLKCTTYYATPIYNPEKCRLTDEIFWLLLPQFNEIQMLGFPWCSTREDLSIDVSITNLAFSTDIDEAMLISFLGVRTDRQTDTVLESSYGNMSAHTKFQLKTQN